MTLLDVGSLLPSLMAVGVIKGTGIGDGTEPGVAVGDTITGPVNSSTPLSLSDDALSFINIDSIFTIWPLILLFEVIPLVFKYMDIIYCMLCW
jgi:hypothetical protein